MRFLLFFLSLTASAFALYEGNPAAPSIIEEGLFLDKENFLSVQTSYQRDYVFDRGMKPKDNLQNREFDQFSYLADQGVLSLNLMNRFLLYGSFGALKFKMDQRSTPSVDNYYESLNQFTFGVGGSILVYQLNAFSVGVDGKYQNAHPRFDYLRVNGVPIADIGNAKVTYNEWQLGVGATYQIEIFYPYVAVKYSHAIANFKRLPSDFISGVSTFKAMNRRKFGVAAGCTLSTGSIFSLNVEMRVIDERAVSFDLKMQF